MRHRQTIVGLLALAVPLLAASAMPGLAVAARPTPQLLSADATAAAASTILDRARRQYSDTFGGMAVTQQGTHVVIYLTRVNAAVRADLGAGLPGQQVSFEISPTTEALQQLRHDQISSSLDAAQRSGRMLIASAGPSVQSGREVIRVVAVTAAKKDYLLRRFGSDVQVEDASPADIPVLTAASRIADGAPWSGGDFISDRGAGCTSGIPTHNAAGQPWMVTAGHCFGAGATVYNYAPAIGLGAATSATRLGSVYSRDFRPGQLDAELIGAAGSSSTWVGPTATTTRRSFAGGAGPVAAGSSVCLSGAYEGEHCGLVVQPNHVDQCVTFNDAGVNHLSCHVTEAIGPSQQSVGSGDSGGPVYQYFGSTPKAVGIVTGAQLPVQCGNWGPPGRMCGNVLYFTNIANILQQWGLRVNG